MNTNMNRHMSTSRECPNRVSPLSLMTTILRIRQHQHPPPPHRAWAQDTKTLLSTW